MKFIVKKYKSLPIQIKASFWFIICAFLQKGISLITTPIFTRIMSTSDFGQYNIFNSWLGITTIFVSLNLSAGVYSQGLIKFDSDRAIFSSSLEGLSTILIISWTIIYVLSIEFWNNLLSLSTVQVLSMLVMIWTSAVFNFWSSEQRVLYKYKLLVIVSVLVSFLKPLIGIMFVIHSNDKVTARILSIFLVELISYSGFYFIQIFRGKKFFDPYYWKYAVKFSVPLIPHYLSQVILNNSDRIMIGSLIGSSEAGIYSLAYSISSIMSLFNIALVQSITPWMYQKIKDKKTNDIEPIAYITLIFVAFVNIILIAFAPEVVEIFAPPSYHDAIYIIMPVSLSVYFMFSYDLFAKYAFYYEKTKSIMITSLVGALLNVVLNFIFLKLYGYVAAAYTTLICYIVYSVGHYLIMNKVCDKFCEGIRPYQLNKIMYITLTFVFVGFLLLISYDYVLIRLIIIVILLLIIISKRKLILNSFKSVTKITK